MGEVECLFTCIICGRAWASKQSLRAHMKVHGGEYQRTSVHVRRGLWERFNEVCRRHKTTSCALLDALMRAVVEGEKSGSVDLSRIGASNPLIINVNEYFLGTPRSAWKTEVPPSHGAGPVCPSCISQNVRAFRQSASGLVEGYCLFCGAEWLLSDRKSRGRVLEG